MTTKNFSSLKLPYPKYPRLNCLNLNEQEYNLKPRLFDRVQIIEARRSSPVKREIVPFESDLILIENCRPELFLRRDFIRKFVDNGKIHIFQLGDEESTSYRMYTSNKNVLSFNMNEIQYRRFGMIASKVIKTKTAKRYRIDIDLKNEKIKTSNKCQDRLVMYLRRLSSIDKIYFRFEPNESGANKSLDFFRYVIDEYATDGFQPVPLTGCLEVSQRIEQSWTRSSQPIPDFNMKEEIIDWLGYQLLSIDCEDLLSSFNGQQQQLEEQQQRQEEDDRKKERRCDVLCQKLDGVFELEQIRGVFAMNNRSSGNNDNRSNNNSNSNYNINNTKDIKDDGADDDYNKDTIIFRSIILYNSSNTVFLLQNSYNGSEFLLTL